VAGYIPFQFVRPIMHRGPVPMPVVDIALIRPVEAPEPVEVAAVPPSSGPVAVRDPALRAYTGVTTSMVREMRDRRAAGQSLSVIAKAVGVTDPTVRRYTKDIAPPEGGWSNGGHHTKLPMDAVRRMRRAGFTYKEIGENFSCCPTSIWRLLNQPRRSTAGRRKPVHRSLEQVSRVTGYTAAQIRKDREGCGGRSKGEIAKARAILFWLVIRKRRVSSVNAGRSLGGFNHTSALHAVKRVDAVIAHAGISTEGMVTTLVRQLWAFDWSEAGV